MVVKVSKGDEGLTVSWEEPASPNGILTNYSVSVEFYGNGSAIVDPIDTNNMTFSTTIDISRLSELVYHSGLLELLLWSVCGACFIDHSLHRRWCSLSCSGSGS